MYIVLLNDDFTPRREVEILGDYEVVSMDEVKWLGGSMGGIKVRWIMTAELREQYSEEDVLTFFKGLKIKEFLIKRDSDIETLYTDLTLSLTVTEEDIKTKFMDRRREIIEAQTLEELDSITWINP